jgi:cytohesin
MAAASAGGKKGKGKSIPAPTQENLLTAIIHKDLDTVRGLLKARAPVNYERGALTTPILTCLENYDKEIFTALLKSGANPNFTGRSTDNSTLLNRPIWIAVQSENADAVRRLIDAKVSLNTVHEFEGERRSPLSHAAAIGNLGLVKILVENGADVNFKGYGIKTPIVLALEKAHPEVVSYLESKGAKNTEPYEPAAATRKRRQVRKRTRRGHRSN